MDQKLIATSLSLLLGILIPINFSVNAVEEEISIPSNSSEEKVQGENSVPTDSSEEITEEETTIETESETASEEIVYIDLILKKDVDGFYANDSHYIDPEGDVIWICNLSSDGWGTYIIKNEDASWSMRMVKPLKGTLPEEIATVVRKNKSYYITTKQGQKVSGSKLFLTSQGFLVNRNNVVFHYTDGQKIKNVAIPQGYFLTSYQPGDIQGTRLILIEKDKSKEGFFEPFKSGRKDYALLNLDTGNIDLILSLDVSLRQKKENPKVIFEKVAWFNTPSGIIVISQENNLGKLFITNLKNNQRVLAFQRGAGINDFWAKQEPDGNLRLKVQLGLSFQEIDNIEEYLSNSQTSIK